MVHDPWSYALFALQLLPLSLWLAGGIAAIIAWPRDSRAAALAVTGFACLINARLGLLSYVVAFPTVSIIKGILFTGGIALLSAALLVAPRPAGGDRR